MKSDHFPALLCASLALYLLDQIVPKNYCQSKRAAALPLVEPTSKAPQPEAANHSHRSHSSSKRRSDDMVSFQSGSWLGDSGSHSGGASDSSCSAGSDSSSF